MNIKKQIQDQQTEIQHLKDAANQSITKESDSSEEGNDNAVENNSSSTLLSQPSTLTNSGDELALFWSMFRKAFGLDPEENTTNPEGEPEDPLTMSITKSLVGEVDEETSDPSIPQVCVDMFDRWFWSINSGS